MKYLSVSEYANKHHKDTGYIRKLLAQGRLEGFKVGKQWVINENTKLPKDERIKTGNYKHFRKIKNIKLYITLNNLIKDLIGVYQDSIESAILYGSYSRGQQTKESDVDVALLLNSKHTKEMQIESTRVLTPHLFECNKDISLVEIDVDDFKRRNDIPFYTNIRKDGILLWNKKNGFNYQNTDMKNL